MENSFGAAAVTAGRNLWRQYADRITDAGSLVFAGVVYLLTIPEGPGYAGDTAKFQFIGYVLGTPHETGYPLYMLLNGLVTHLLPFGSLAYRANLQSALAALGTLAFLAATLRHLTVSRTARVLAVAAFAVTATFWSQAIVAEVYTLHALLVAGTVYFLLRWHDDRSPRWFLAFAVTYSLGFANHGTMIFLLPAIVYLVWQTDVRTFVNRRYILMVAGSVMLGISMYAYIWLRTLDPATPYLEMKASSLKEFLYYLTGGQFRDRMFHQVWNYYAFVQVPFFAELLVREYYVLLFAIAAGLFFIARPVIGIFLVLACASFYAFAIGYDIPDVYVYVIPAYYCLAVFLGAGIDVLLGRARRLRIPLVAAHVAGIAFLVWANIPEIKAQSGLTERQETERVLQVAGRHSVIATFSYPYAMFLSYYTIGEERERTDSLFVYFRHKEVSAELAISTFLEPLIAYVNRGEPLYLPTERVSLPPGLKVFFLAREHTVPSSRMYTIPNRFPDFFANAMEKTVYEPARRMLRERGVRVDSVSPGLYRLTPGAAGDSQGTD